jgi:centrosomal protein POC5
VQMNSNPVIKPKAVRVVNNIIQNGIRDQVRNSQSGNENHQIMKSSVLLERADPVGQDRDHQNPPISADNSHSNSFLTFQSLAIDKSLSHLEFNKGIENSATSSGVQSEAQFSNYNTTSDSNESENVHRQMSSTVQNNGNSNNNNSNFRVFDDMAAQMRNALKQEIMQQILKEQERAGAKLDKQKTQFTKEMKRLLDTLKSAQTEIKQLQSELEQRDTAVDCLMKSLDTQKSEFLARKAIYKWKDCLKERKMERFSERLAEKHFSQVLLRKTLITWKENKNTQWRERVTLNCQSKAESMCKLLSERYEAQLEQLESKLRKQEVENCRLRSEREDFQSQMKEAFMRGVCALNLEAMKVLSPSSSKTNSQTELSVHPSGNTGNEASKMSRAAIARRKLTADLESATDLEYVKHMEMKSKELEFSNFGIDFRNVNFQEKIRNSESSGAAQSSSHNDIVLVDSRFIDSRIEEPKCPFPSGLAERTTGEGKASTIPERQIIDYAKISTKFDYAELRNSEIPKFKPSMSTNLSTNLSTKLSSKLSTKPSTRQSLKNNLKTAPPKKAASAMAVSSFVTVTAKPSKNVNNANLQTKPGNQLGNQPGNQPGKSTNTTKNVINHKNSAAISHKKQSPKLTQQNLSSSSSSQNLQSVQNRASHRSSSTAFSITTSSQMSPPKMGLSKMVPKMVQKMVPM